MSEALSSLSQARCSIYPDKPAAARCPECRRFYSAGCITEHEGRLICSPCLEKKSQVIRQAKPAAWSGLFSTSLQYLAALMVLWLIYHYIAGVLAGIPTEFHDGTIWE